MIGVLGARLGASISRGFDAAERDVARLTAEERERFFARHRYVKRIGQETVGSAVDGLDDASVLFRSGHADHVAATLACPRCTLVQVAIGGRVVMSVGSAVVDALDRARASIELPAETWPGNSGVLVASICAVACRSSWLHVWSEP